MLASFSASQSIPGQVQPTQIIVVLRGSWFVVRRPWPRPGLDSIHPPVACSAPRRAAVLLRATIPTCLRLPLAPCSTPHLLLPLLNSALFYLAPSLLDDLGSRGPHHSLPVFRCLVPYLPHATVLLIAVSCKHFDRTSALPPASLLRASCPSTLRQSESSLRCLHQHSHTWDASLTQDA